MPGYECGVCEGAEQAAILVTPLTGGDTMPLGASCAPVGLVSIIASMTGVDADGLYDAVRKHVDREHKAAEEAASGKPETPRRRRAPRNTEAEPASVTGRQENGE